MIETIKHLLGFCGEPHGLAYYILFGGTFVSAVITYLKSKINFKIQLCVEVIDMPKENYFKSTV